MCPEDTNGQINGPPIEVKCKIDTDAGANIMPVYVFRKLCPAMFDSSGKALKKLDADWTTNSIWRQYDQAVWGKNNQMLLEQPEVEISLSHCRCCRPNTAGIFEKHPMVYIETIDIQSMIQHRLASQQIKKGEEDENHTENQVASEVTKVGAMC